MFSVKNLLRSYTEEMLVYLMMDRLFTNFGSSVIVLNVKDCNVSNLCMLDVDK